MNKERILHLADVLDSIPKNHKFDMAKWFHDFIPGGGVDALEYDCGTPSCVAGWALYTFGDDLNYRWVETEALSRDAGQLLGIDSEDADRLFLPDEVNYEMITPAIAASVLREFARTGEVEWPEEVSLDVEEDIW